MFDLIAIQGIITDLLADDCEATEYIELIADFRKAGMKDVEKDGVSASVRGRCALDLAS